MFNPPPTTVLADVPVARVSRIEALAEIERLHDAYEPARVVFAHTHTLYLATRSTDYRAILRRASLVLPDGHGLHVAARVGGSRIIENCNGTDMSPLVLSMAARRGWRVFFLGGRPGVADSAATRMASRFPGLRVVGTMPGHPLRSVAEVVAAVRSAKASVLLVAFGNPLQEYWLDAHLPATGARLGLGVGGFFDFASGAVPRAPRWMRRSRLEWSFRLLQDPRRFWRRYLVHNPIFITKVLAGSSHVAARKELDPTEAVALPHVGH